MLSIWDPKEENTLRIDLWTKDMMVDEMADFFYQNLMGMGDTYLRATQDKVLAESFKTFAKTFYNQFRASQIEQGTK